jgi:hypothetical protein
MSAATLAALVPGQGVGAIQAAATSWNQTKVFDLLRQGTAASEIIRVVTASDFDSDVGIRQYAAVTLHQGSVLSLTALQYTRPRRPVYATRDRPMYTSHDRPVYTTRDRLVYTTPDRPVCTTYGVRLHSPPTMSPGGAIHGAHTHELSA